MDIKNKTSKDDFNDTSNKIDVNSNILFINGTGNKLILPLEMRWQPKEDITTYELAKCLPYLIRSNSIMPYEIDKTETHFRHFDIIEYNH